MLEVINFGAYYIIWIAATVWGAALGSVIAYLIISREAHHTRSFPENKKLTGHEFE